MRPTALFILGAATFGITACDRAEDDPVSAKQPIYSDVKYADSSAGAITALSQAESMQMIIDSSAPIERGNAFQSRFRPDRSARVSKSQLAGIYHTAAADALDRNGKFSEAAARRALATDNIVAAVQQVAESGAYFNSKDLMAKKPVSRFGLPMRYWFADDRPLKTAARDLANSLAEFKNAEETYGLLLNKQNPSADEKRRLESAQNTLLHAGFLSQANGKIFYNSGFDGNAYVMGKSEDFNLAYTQFSRPADTLIEHLAEMTLKGLSILVIAILLALIAVKRIFFRKMSS